MDEDLYSRAVGIDNSACVALVIKKLAIHRTHANK